MHALYAHIMSGLLIVLLPFLALVIKVVNPATMGAILLIAALFITLYQNTTGIRRANYDALSFWCGFLLIFMSLFAK